MQYDKVIILARGRNFESPIYRSWSGSLSLPHTYVQDYDENWAPPDDAGLIVTAQHYEEPEISILRRAREQYIPTLVLADGILEYRNTWENPALVPGSLFQPVQSDKIATIGRSQTRILESWGNVGKCEVVGAPRLDGLIRQPARDRGDAPFTVLVTTARTPGFTDAQRQAIVASLQDLKEWFDRTPAINGTPIRVVWRLTEQMDDAIGTNSQISDTLGKEFADIIRNADALITTPSTTMLEGMLCGIPVALLDYTNSPAYVPAAWSITAARHIETVVPELTTPTQARMLYQDTVLHDALECSTAATPRMVQLIEQLVALAAPARVDQTAPVFPDAILPQPAATAGNPEPRFDLQALYPDHPVFSDMDRARLQVQILHLEASLQDQKQTLAALTDASKTTAPSSFIRELWQSLPGPRKLRRLYRRNR